MIDYGFLIYDDTENRFAICSFGDNQEIDRLHCGDTVAIKIKNEFVSTRVELNGEDLLYDWCFVGVGKCAMFIGKTIERR